MASAMELKYFRRSNGVSFSWSSSSSRLQVLHNDRVRGAVTNQNGMSSFNGSAGSSGSGTSSSAGSDDSSG